MTTACFTGHRKLGEAYYNRNNPSTEWHTLRQYMDQVVSSMIEMPHYVDRFISGLAIGVDMLGAESVAYVRTLKKDPITLVGAMPFPSQPNRWPEPTRQHWHHVCGLCNEVVAVSADPYHPSKMQIRNEWMVNNSTYVIAVWDGMKNGGTWNCINYAKAQGKPVFCIQPLGLQWQGAWLTGEI